MDRDRMRLERVALGSGLVSLALEAASAVAASAVQAQEAPPDREQSFQAVKGAVKEDVAGGPLLVAAYGLIWAVMLLYVVRLVRKQQRAQADLTRLERVLSQGADPR